MGKVLFIPVSIIGGFIAGLIGKKAFEGIWAAIDDQEPPDSEHRETTYPKLILALLIEGAIFRAVRGVVDHASRRRFYRATGSWPGEPRPEPEAE